MPLKNLSLFILSFLLAGFVLTAGAATVIAAEAASSPEEQEWVPYVSETGLYKTRFVKSRDTKIYTLRLDPNTVAQSEISTAVIDERPFRNSSKTYSIKVEQTLGRPLTDAQINTLVDHEMKTFIERYRSKNAVVKESKKELFDNIIGAEIYMSYEDKDAGLMGVRARILVSETTKLTQVVVGGDQGMHSMVTEDFFGSLKLTPGFAKKKGEFAAEWKEHPSPLQLFSLLLPDVTPPYVMEKPTVKHSEKSEMMGLVFSDPIKGEKIFYNVYGYKLDRNLTYGDAQKVALARHVGKHLSIPKGVTFNKVKTTDYPMFTADYAIPAPDAYPYIQVAKLRVTFIKDYMMVQEIVSSRALYESPLVASLMSLAMFTPEKAHVEFLKKGYPNTAPDSPNSKDNKEKAAPAEQKKIFVTPQKGQ